MKKILKRHKKIDVFMHDSLHTYSHMMAEFKIAWPQIKKEGFLISDDVAFNDSFLEFAKKVKKVPIIISRGAGLGFFGVLRK